MVATLQTWRTRRNVRQSLTGLGLDMPLSIGDCLHRGDTTSVFSARMGDLDVAIKHRRGPQAGKKTECEAREISEKGARLVSGPFRVAQLIQSAPETGTLILERLDGRNGRALLTEEPEARLPMVRAAGAWLAAYTRGERASDDFGGNFWVRRRGEQAETVPGPKGRDLARQLVALMRDQRRLIANRPITRARSHGHFIPENLLMTPEMVWGTGLSDGHWIAVVRDFARFLIQLQIDAPGEGTDGAAGFPEDDIAAFAESGLVYQGEIDAALPFFTASELVGLMALGESGPAESVAGTLLASMADSPA